MMQPSRAIGAGVFVVTGVLLFTVALFLIGERRQMFADKIEIYTEFANMAGLVEGAQVRLAGLEAGEVTEIRVPPGPSAKFRVKIEVREDLRQLIRTDSVAAIQTEGLVGGQFLNITIGSEQAPAIGEKGTIPSREPFQFADLVQQMSDTVTLINSTVSELKGDLESAVNTFAETAENADKLIEEVGGEVKAITVSGRRVAADAEIISARLRNGQGTIGKLLHDDELFRRAKEIVTQGEAAMKDLREATAQAKQAIAGFQSKDGPAGGLMADARETIGQAREALTDLADNMEALKRNFLFRGFFNSRGFFDLDDVTPEQYRAGALEGGKREALRIWLDAGAIFAKDSSGVESLSMEGRERLDSALATLLTLPPNNPLVVEGFATEGSRDQQYLISRARAAIVRRYLVAKFHLKPQLTGIMPLGATAPGSPAGDRWDGIALTLFAERPPKVETTRAGRK